MANHSASDQLRFLTQWFRTWSDYQKEDFLQALSAKLGPKSAPASVTINGIVTDMQSLNTCGRPPSLFSCQLKLFNEWWDSWSEEERGAFTEQLKSSDAKFWADVENELDGTRAREFDDFFTVIAVAPSSTSPTSVKEGTGKSDEEIISNGVPVSPVTITNTNNSNISNEDNVNTESVVAGDEAGVMKKGEDPVTEDGQFKTTIEVKNDAQAAEAEATLS